MNLRDSKAQILQEYHNAMFELSKVRQELESVKREVQLLTWHKQANDRFLDILGASAKEGRVTIERTTREDMNQGVRR